jgi:hypothetical protein
VSEAGLADDFRLILRLHSKFPDLNNDVINLAGFALRFVFARSDRIASVVID